jgi:predicted nucleotidyltransferase
MEDQTPIVEFLKNDENVKPAYLFGSHARGRLGPLSDLDIAVYLDRGVDRWTYRLKFMEKLAKDFALLTLKVLGGLGHFLYPAWLRSFLKEAILLYASTRFFLSFKSELTALIKRSCSGDAIDSSVGFPRPSILSKPSQKNSPDHIPCVDIHEWSACFSQGPGNHCFLQNSVTLLQ